MASKAAYGPNPHPGVDPNNNADWGGYQWPLGVPSWLLAVVTVPGDVRIVIRKELAELVSLMYQIADVKYGRRFTRGWTGGYQNRPIAGTFSPSNHSKGRAIDNDAASNPMSAQFISDIPPGLIADWESLGWYWGGRYTGKFDTMHVEFPQPMGTVATHVVNARRILANAQGIPENPAPGPAPTDPTPAPIPEDDMYNDAARNELVARIDAARTVADATKAELDNLVPVVVSTKELVDKVGTLINTGLNDMATGVLERLDKIEKALGSLGK